MRPTPRTSIARLDAGATTRRPISEWAVFTVFPIFYYYFPQKEIMNVYENFMPCKVFIYYFYALMIAYSHVGAADAQVSAR